MKANTSTYDAVDKCSPKQQICDNASISFMVIINWAYPPTASGSYGRLSGCQTKSGWIREDLHSVPLSTLGRVITISEYYQKLQSNYCGDTYRNNIVGIFQGLKFEDQQNSF